MQELQLLEFEVHHRHAQALAEAEARRRVWDLFDSQESTRRFPNGLSRWIGRRLIALGSWLAAEAAHDDLVSYGRPTKATP
jgi:hypothetical protein